MNKGDEMKTSLIYLVGFMGAGKTSVGRRLSELLDWTFMDLDVEIERREGLSIREIFESMGEPRFREIERAELEKAGRLNRAVVALGGGTFCTPENRSIVRASGVSVWLDLPIETLYRRCSEETRRPLFTTLEEMKALLKGRTAFYRQADYRLAADEFSVDAAANMIISLLFGQ